MTEVRTRTRTRPAAPVEAAPQVRTRSRPIPVEPEDFPRELPGMGVSCGICRNAEDARGPYLGRVERTDTKGDTYLVHPYKGKGEERDPRSFLAPKTVNGMEKAMDVLRKHHTCNTGPAKKSDPTWVTGATIPAARTRQRKPAQ